MLTQINALRCTALYAVLKDDGRPQSEQASMYHEFAVKPLTGQLVQKAYPFAAALGVHNLESWRRFVESYAPADRNAALPDSGGIAVEDPNGYVCGLLFYRVQREGADGTTLVCNPFLVADLPRYAAPVRALLEKADRIACQMRCKWIRVVLPATGDPLNEAAGCESSLFRAGYALESLNFRRRRPLPARAAQQRDAIRRREPAVK